MKLNSNVCKSEGIEGFKETPPMTNLLVKKTIEIVAKSRPIKSLWQS